MSLWEYPISGGLRPSLSEQACRDGVTGDDFPFGD
jgi:hypothetical protein